MDKIDPEMLIGLVRSRPGLWDKSSDCRKDIVQRADSWNDICRALNPDYDSLNRKDRSAYVKIVMKKWTNIRDAWKKTISEDKRKFKPYLYHEQLKFLLKNICCKKSECSDGDTTKDKTDDSDDAADSIASFGNIPPAKRPRTVEQDERENSMIQFMDVKNIVSEDAHLSFFKGLLPTLNKLDDDETLEFQVGVIRLLQEMRRKGRAEEPPQYYNMPSSSYEMPVIKKEM